MWASEGRHSGECVHDQCGQSEEIVLCVCVCVCVQAVDVSCKMKS